MHTQPWQCWITKNKKIASIVWEDTVTGFHRVCEIHKSANENFADDAAFIVRACNSHDALLEAAKEMLRCANDQRTESTNEWVDAVTQLEAAIAAPTEQP